jgi:putative two-component system response regulator
MLKRFADEHEHAEHVILTLAKAIDARDPYTAGHSGRVADYADQIGLRMGLDVVTRNDLRRGALLHDLGKITIPDAVLRKRDRLTSAERALLDRHPEIGRDLLSPIRAMRRILPIVYCHHERLDGSGYPEGITEKEIPLVVRIVAVADVFDEITRTRGAMAAAEELSAEMVRHGLETLQHGVRYGWWDGDAVETLRGAISDSGWPFSPDGTSR